MNFLDWCLVLLVLLYALSGYWQGFIAGAFATVGLVLGGILGIWVAPHLLGEANPSVWVSLGALFMVRHPSGLADARAAERARQWPAGSVTDQSA